MSIPANLVNQVYKSAQVSEGSINGTTDPITFTETKGLADQKVFGSALGPNATATVTAQGTDANGNPTITVQIGNSGTFADGQSITGTVIGNDASDLLLSGNLFGTQGFLYVTNTAAQQPGVGASVLIRAEPQAPLYTAPACYCEGTIIATDQGDLPVQALAIGDRVLTVTGGARTIRWIGRRSYAGRFLAGRDSLLPIRFLAGSLGDGVPRRDLLVSPNHAMFLDGILVPAAHLVNGFTILQDRTVSRVDYYHVELDSHDVIWAEGAASETFIDDDSRAAFHNASEHAALYPDADVQPAVFCARRMTDGFEVEVIRAAIAARIPALALAS